MHNEKMKNLLHAGADTFGGVVGAGSGLILDGPGGALLGGAAGPLMTASLKSVIGDVANRNLSHREQTRVGTAAIHAMSEVTGEPLTVSQPSLAKIAGESSPT
jgi:hypothetical protein